MSTAAGLRRRLIVAAVTCVSVVLAGCPGPAAAVVGFGSATDVIVGTTPTALGLGDFNNDGKRDIVVVNQGASTVQLLLGDGAGGFSAQAAVASVTSAGVLAVADLDGDGHRDVIVGSRAAAGAVAVHYGDGSSTLAAATSLFDEGQVVNALVVADLDGDGTLDVAIGHAGGLSIYRGQGQRTFTRVPAVLTAAVLKLKSGDLGSAPSGADLAAGLAQSIAIVRWNGTDFVAEAELPLGSSEETTVDGVAIGDLDHDGKIDLVVSINDPEASATGVFLLQRTGSWAFAAAALLSSLAAGDLLVIDADLDGRRDVVVVLLDGTTVILVGDGSGGISGVAGPHSSGVAGLVPLAVRDVSGDGRPEIIHTKADLDRVAVLLNTTSLPEPALSALVPSTRIVAPTGFPLTVTGSGFSANSRVRWNGDDRATTFVDGGTLIAQIRASDRAEAGEFPVTVFTPPPGGGTSGPLTFIVGNRTPVVKSVDPASKLVAPIGFVLTVKGSNFVATSSKVLWEGAERETEFVDANTLTAQILASDRAAAGLFEVSVFTPAPGGGTSNAVTVAINNRVPVVKSLSPSSRLVGSAGFTLTVNGANFVDGTKVKWNGFARPTKFVSATQLRATIPASDLTVAAVVKVRVVAPGPGGGPSNTVEFRVRNPVPTITSLTPSEITEDSPSFSLTVRGTNFVEGSRVLWGGLERETTVVSDTEVTATVLQADITETGSVEVKVRNPAPGGGVSGGLSFVIKIGPH